MGIGSNEYNLCSSFYSDVANIEDKSGENEED